MSFKPTKLEGGEGGVPILTEVHEKSTTLLSFHFLLQVKGGGAIPPKGTVYTLNAVSRKDFQRDVLKSDTAMLEVPQIELVMEMGTLGSMYTTIEGLLNKVPTKGGVRSTVKDTYCTPI